MTIGIVGANGRTGQLVVREALSRGHKVIAGVRGNNSLEVSDNLVVMDCDVLNTDQVDQLVKRSDAVISTLGHVKGSPEFMQSDGIANIIKSMNKHSKKRLLSLTGTGVRFTGDKITLIDRVLNLSIGLIDPKRIADGKKHVEIIRATNLDWTILRVLKLQNTKPKKFKLTLNGPTKTYVSRCEVASAMLDIVEQDLFSKQSPIISDI